jgi:hypothetical protein
MKRRHPVWEAPYWTRSEATRPPSAGMFVWLAVHLDSHKDFEKVKARGEDPNRVLLEKLFIELAEHKVSQWNKDNYSTTR